MSNKMNKIFIVIGFVVIIAVLIFSFFSLDSNTSDLKNEFGYKDISSAELMDMMNNKDFLLIDVHIPEQQHIKGTDMFIPYEEINLNFNKLPSDKSKKIVLYCRSGSMSAEASKILVERGYTNVYNLKNGVNEWKYLGYPME